MLGLLHDVGIPGVEVEIPLADANTSFCPKLSDGRGPDPVLPLDGVFLYAEL
jgi:hypothetical protein